MITTNEALSALFELVSPLGTETVSLRDAAGRMLAEPAVARRDQPPFAASAMDGYAVRDADVKVGASFNVIGEAAAGHAFGQSVGPGEAARIFTGAPVPEGADRVIIQEDVTRDGDVITLNADLDTGFHIRPAGGDFRIGQKIEAPRRLAPSDLALLASMNIPEVVVYRRPEVALIATGDELVMPGEDPAPDQIVASNSFGLAAMIDAAGGHARMLPIARDSEASLNMAFDLAAGADLVVTIGGASVGDHDLVAQVAATREMEQSFYKVAMRPGKPLMAGRLDGMAMVGLPGNPVSAMVCGTIFLVPMLRVMLGLPAEPVPRETASLAAPLGKNGPREHYMRATLTENGVTAFDRQDSSLLSVLSAANALLVRAPHDPPRAQGEAVDIIRLS
ncbi:MAG: molybdopterin molybdotransferase MoeA [Rhodobacteraceae bacterium]|nr:molybdopterin molybdotransferase MoeA [Paracoccaceae bacterium]